MSPSQAPNQAPDISSEPALLLPQILLTKVTTALQSGERKEAIALLEGFHAGVTHAKDVFAGLYSNEVILAFLRKLQVDITTLKEEQTSNPIENISENTRRGATVLFTPEAAQVMTKS